MMKFISYIPNKYRQLLRDKAIARARTRIVIAGRDPEQFAEEDLEVVVREEEDKLRGEIRDKGLLAVLALLGLNFFG